MRGLKAASLILAMLLLLLAVGIFWLFYTVSGAQFLFATISRVTSGKISVTSVEGALARRVSISGLTIRLSETTASAAKVVFSVSPTTLFIGRFDIDPFNAKDVEVVNIGPKEKRPFSFVPPHVSRFVASLEGRIHTLSLDNVRYRYQSEEPTIIDRISGQVRWHQGELIIKHLVADTPAGQISGSVDVGFYRPSLRSELWITANAQWANFDQLFVKTDLEPAFGRATMKGPVTAWVYKDKESRISLSANLSASEHLLDVRKLKLVRYGQEGSINASGRILTNKTIPRFTAGLEADRFSLADLSPISMTLSGKANIDGTSEAYGGRFTIFSAARDWQAFKVDGTFKGDRQRAAAQISSAQWLGGTLVGKVAFDWEKQFQMTGDLGARGLRTGLIDETWQGILNADASFRFIRSASGEPTAALSVRLLDSTFKQRPVKGIINAAYEKGTLQLTQLALQGKGFDVTAHGILAEKIDFNANIGDLSSMLPRAKGIVTSQGWLRYNKGDFAMGLSGIGKDIQYQRLRAGRIQVSANLDRTGAKILNIEGQGQSLAYGGVDFASLRTAITGKTTDHEAFVTATGAAGARMRVALRGSYEKGAWKGTVKELTGSDRQHGEWRLESSSALHVSAKRFYLEPLVLQARGGENITATVDLRLKPAHGFIKAEWSNLDLSRLDPVIPVSLHLRARGHLFLDWAKGSLDQLILDFSTQQGELRYRESSLPIYQAGISIGWTMKGLKGTGQMVLTDGGMIRGDVASNLRPRLDLPDQARFSTVWRGLRLVNLNPFLSVGTRVQGTAAGAVEGRLLPNKSFTMDTFNARVTEALLVRRTEAGSSQVSIPDARVEGGWNEKGVNGHVVVNAAQMGSVQADVLLPIPAHLPLKIIPSGAVSVNARARIQNIGPLAVLLPKTIRKPEGRMEVSASANGTWERPNLNAFLALQDGGFYLTEVDLRVQGARVDGRLSWNGQGLSTIIDVQLNQSGLLQAKATSAVAPRMEFPDTATISARWTNIDMALIKPLLPDKLGMTGQVAGNLDGTIFPGKKLSAIIETRVMQGGFTWQTERGIARATLKSMSVKAAWNGEGLKGQMELELARQGRLHGSFLLPIPGRFPVQAIPAGPIDIRLDGQVQEEGMLSSFFPGLVQETSGSLTVNARVNGTWEDPRLAGGAQLSNAGAYLPTAGIRIESVGATIVFSENTINIGEFSARSGPGRIGGSGTLSLRDGRIERYTGRLSGERFQTVYLPDLRLLVSPSLSLSGTGNKMVVEGEIRVPQLHVYGPPTENVVRPSPDVVLVGVKEKPKRKLPIDLQAKVRVVLGDDVRIKMQGIDAKLEGAVVLNVSGEEDIRAAGEIRVAKGQYSTYGVELQITRGRITFAGPLQRARLDILAIRKIERVARTPQISDRLLTTTTSGASKVTGPQPSSITSATSTETQTVGVQITGILQRPRIDLYSSPALSDADTLSYMILGRPVSGDAAQASLLFGAAGTLLGQGEAGSIQQQLKNLLGLETIEFGTETVTTEQGQVEQTMVRVGRYLAPNLYIGLGRSLFTNEYVITARYSLSKRWEIQTKAGAQTGGGIYYKIEFD